MSLKLWNVAWIFFAYFPVSHVLNYHELNNLPMCHMVTLLLSC